MSFPELYVLRHGETEWNAQARFQGALNSPLTEQGRRQAAQQGAILRSCDLTGFQFFTSPQGRAVQTAGIAVAPIAPLIHTDERLREIGVGDWSGKSRKELLREAGLDEAEGPDGNLSLYERAPNGEGFAALKTRCDAFLSGLTGPSVLVTHGITSRMLRCLVLGIGSSGLASIEGGQGNVFHLKDGVQKELK